MTTPRPTTRSRRRRMAALAALGVTSSALFAATTVAARGGRGARWDRRLRGRLRRGVWGQGPAPRHLTAKYVGKLGDSLAYVPLGVLSHLVLPRLGLRGGGVVLAAAGTVGVGRHAFRWMIPRLRPPTHLLKSNFFASYPSGHSTGASAVGLTLAHVLADQGRVRALPAFGLALGVTAAVSAARVVRDAHWATDVVGGVFAGTAVYAAAALAYEAGAARQPRPAGPE
jgi:membrane-associated phospholipid phosphatase